jgi:hypothetical protein
LIQGLVKVGYYHSLPASVAEIKGLIAHYLFACPYTATAKYAAVMIDHYSVTEQIKGERRVSIVESNIVDLISIGQLL